MILRPWHPSLAKWSIASHKLPVNDEGFSVGFLGAQATAREALLLALGTFAGATFRCDWVILCALRIVIDPSTTILVVVVLSCLHWAKYRGRDLSIPPGTCNIPTTAVPLPYTQDAVCHGMSYIPDKRYPLVRFPPLFLRVHYTYTTR